MHEGLDHAVYDLRGVLGDTDSLGWLVLRKLRHDN
jgi:hypothetical protein